MTTADLIQEVLNEHKRTTIDLIMKNKALYIFHTIHHNINDISVYNSRTIIDHKDVNIIDRILYKNVEKKYEGDELFRDKLYLSHISITPLNPHKEHLYRICEEHLYRICDIRDDYPINIIYDSHYDDKYSRVLNGSYIFGTYITSKGKIYCATINFNMNDRKITIDTVSKSFEIDPIDIYICYSKGGTAREFSNINLVPFIEIHSQWSPLCTYDNLNLNSLIKLNEKMIHLSYQNEIDNLKKKI